MDAVDKLTSIVFVGAFAVFAIAIIATSSVRKAQNEGIVEIHSGLKPEQCAGCHKQ